MIDKTTLVHEALQSHDKERLAQLGAELVAETRILCQRSKQRFSVRQCAELAASARALQYAKSSPGKSRPGKPSLKQGEAPCSQA